MNQWYRCVSNYQLEDELTEGKIYNASDKAKYSIMIINDRGQEGWYSSERFMYVEEPKADIRSAINHQLVNFMNGLNHLTYTAGIHFRIYDGKLFLVDVNENILGHLVCTDSGKYELIECQIKYLRNTDTIPDIDSDFEINPEPILEFLKQKNSKIEKMPEGVKSEKKDNF